MKTLIQFTAIMFVFIAAQMTAAQTTAFKYQGKLTDAGAAQATYQMQFKLFDALAGGSQIDATVENASVAVTDGVFSVNLDFGANVFTGADRFLEISVRRSASENYTTLNPRQQIASSPYSIRTLSAQQADMSLDSQKLGGVSASEYITNANGGNSFIRTGTTLQPGSFNISGNGLFGGNLGIGTTSPLAKLTVAGSGVFNAPNAARFDLFNTAFNGGYLQHVLDNGTWQFATTGGATRMVVSPGGNVGIGMTNPSHTLDTLGYIRSLNNVSTGVVAETTGGTNTWARFSMRSASQGWFMGTSQNFNGNQFYLGDENTGQSRMTIQPNGGAIAFPFGNVGIGTGTPTQLLHVQSPTNAAAALVQTPTNAFAQYQLKSGGAANWTVGTQDNFADGALLFRNGTTDLAAIRPNGNMTQPAAANGLPKAMIYINGDAAILRCYNGVTGASGNNCGFTSQRTVGSGHYVVNFNFQIDDRFWSATVTNTCCNGQIVPQIERISSSQLRIYLADSDGGGGADRPVMLIVY